MPRRVVIDVFLVTLTVPRDPRGTTTTALQRTLNSTTFQDRLRKSVAAVCRAYPSLRNVRVELSR